MHSHEPAYSPEIGAMTTDAQQRILDYLQHLDVASRERLRRMLDDLEAEHGSTLFMMRVRQRLAQLDDLQQLAA